MHFILSLFVVPLSALESVAIVILETMVKPMWKKENWRVLYFLSFPDLWLCSFQRSFYGVLGLPVSLAFGKNYQMSDFGTVKKTVQCALKINNGLKSLIRGREEVDMKYHHLAPSFLNSNYFLLYISWNKKRYQNKISEVDRPLFLL